MNFKQCHLIERNERGDHLTQDEIFLVAVVTFI
jgi:hypothetical protein